MPSSCSKCSAVDSFHAVGPGVERLEEEVRFRFPAARISIASSDTLSGPVRLSEFINDVQELKVDIIIGTQVIAKGHHFPLVTCVGVEEAFQTEVRSETVYYTSSLRFDMDFGDMFDEPGAFLNLPDTYRDSMDILKISDIVLTRHELKSESLLWIKNMLKDNMKRRLSYGRNLSTVSYTHLTLPTILRV